MKVIRSLGNRVIFCKEIPKELVVKKKKDLLGLLIRTGLYLMKSLLTPLAKSILVPFVLTTAAPATDAVIQKKIYGSGTELVFSNVEIDDIIK